MAKYAVVDSSTNQVSNVIEWDGESAWAPPEGQMLVAVGEGVSVDIGFFYDEEENSFYGPE